MKNRLTDSAARRQSMREGGATQAETDWRMQLSAWFTNHLIVAQGSFRRMSDAWLASLMTCAVIGIALALPTWMYLALINLGDISGGWSHQSRISVYLDTAISEDQARRFSQTLTSMEGVDDTRFISADQALEEFQGSTGLADVLRGLPGNPLPATILVFPTSAPVSDIERLSERLTKYDGVAEVSIDLVWVERLYSALALGQRIVMALSAVLGAAVVLIIGNTIRLMIENRRNEIEVVKLVGGTDSFVRRPFLYTGFWYGLGGGLISVSLVEVSLLWISGPFSKLLGLYDSQYQLKGIGDSNLIVLLGAAGLGLIGAWIAVNRHLDDIEPG